MHSFYWITVLWSVMKCLMGGCMFTVLQWHWQTNTFPARVWIPSRGYSFHYSCLWRTMVYQHRSSLHFILLGRIFEVTEYSTQGQAFQSSQKINRIIWKSGLKHYKKHRWVMDFWELDPVVRAWALDSLCVSGTRSHPASDGSSVCTECDWNMPISLHSRMFRLSSCSSPNLPSPLLVQHIFMLFVTHTRQSSPLHRSVCFMQLISDTCSPWEDLDTGKKSSASGGKEDFIIKREWLRTTLCCSLKTSRILLAAMKPTPSWTIQYTQYTNADPSGDKEVKNVAWNIRNSRWSEYWNAKRAVADTPSVENGTTLLFAMGLDGLGYRCLYCQRQAIEELGAGESWHLSWLPGQLSRCQPDTLTGGRLASRVMQPGRHVSPRNQPGLHQKYIDTDTFLQSVLGHQAGSPPIWKQHQLFQRWGDSKRGVLWSVSTSKLEQQMQEKPTRKGKGLLRWKGQLFSFANADVDLFCLHIW